MPFKRFYYITLENSNWSQLQKYFISSECKRFSSNGATRSLYADTIKHNKKRNPSKATHLAKTWIETYRLQGSGEEMPKGSAPCNS